MFYCDLHSICIHCSIAVFYATCIAHHNRIKVNACTSFCKYNAKQLPLNIMFHFICESIHLPNVFQTANIFNLIKFYIKDWYKPFSKTFYVPQVPNSLSFNTGILMYSRTFPSQTFWYCKTGFPCIQVFTHKQNL